MHRPHQFPMTPNGPPYQPGTPVHSWYAGYPQPPTPTPLPPANVTPQVIPQEQQQQVWHHHHHVPHHGHHPVFQHEYPEYVPYHHMGHHHLGQPEVHHQLPSPPITVSGSDMSSPGGQSDHMISPQMNHNNMQNRPPPARSPYEWIKKTSYNSQPNPGKTRTKDKYRVVYTDHQRIELEKEFTFNNKYITIRRKSELALNLGLSERQIKIWFQNRRAKERKQNKKRVEEKSQLDIVNSNGYAQNMMNPIPQLQNLDLHGQQTVLSNMMSSTPSAVMQRFMEGQAMKMENNNESDQIG